MGASSDTVIHINDVVALVGGFPVLSGMSFSLRRSEVVALHGPNGAGKTSLLRVCAGLLPIERGGGSVLGFDLVEHRRLFRQRVGLLGDRSGLYPSLTVAENLAFWGATVSASRQEIDGVRARFGLDGRLAGVRVERLSTGQKRRAALACLMVRRAEIWLLDEPHAGLDAEARDRLDEIVRAAASAGVSVVLASHEHDRSRAVADRIVQVAGGRLVEQC